MGKENNLTAEKQYNKIIEWENVNFADIKGALLRSSNDKEDCVENRSCELEANEKSFKSLLLWDENKLKGVKAKQPLLTNTHIFENDRIEWVKKDKRIEYFLNWNL